jgi:hypothetical protein
MPRIRTIKPEFFLDDEVAALKPLTRLLYVGLWTQADRAGRLKDKPTRIKAAILPYDRCNVDAMLDELVTPGFITRYHVDGHDYIEIRNFGSHQRFNNESTDVLPGVCEDYVSPSVAVIHGKEGKGKEGKGGEGTRACAREDAPPTFEECYNAYPVHRFEDEARVAFSALPADDHPRILAACKAVPRTTRQSLGKFIAEGTWRDHIPKAKRAPCANPACISGFITRGDEAHPCPDCKGGAS